MADPLDIYLTPSEWPRWARRLSIIAAPIIWPLWLLSIFMLCLAGLVVMVAVTTFGIVSEHWGPPARPTHTEERGD